ncbi:hypothetical protein DL89DRAFT_266348 [Linderina pennispora]|uniref:Uncharacterized protein n=1 Tax=Linderina pennispora TaxID=61395 RepID=A0A1Y1WCS4_9FUNG|nr:uncharacterized protein DL89DRAFT_266348 [Linderina pennispora]ORX71331.1 hypothetical protein DL89DRAFT_266348 [Linderina pennispora]
MTTDTPVPLGLDIESTHSGDPKQTKQIVEPASIRRQVGRSVLTLGDEGYLLRSIDTPDRTLLVRFNGSVLAKGMCNVARAVQH